VSQEHQKTPNSEASLTPCTECGEMVEGERFEYTSKGLIYYEKVGKGGYTHVHRSPKFYEQRAINAKKKPKPVEKAMAKLLLNPKNKKALKTLRKWETDSLYAVATDPKSGYDGLRAMSKLIQMFEGGPEEQPPRGGINRVVVSPNQIPPAAETPKPEIIIHMLEANEAAKPRYDPMAIKPEIIEQDDEELPDDEYAYEPAEQEPDLDTVAFDGDGTRKRKPECVTASFTVWPGGEITRQLRPGEAEDLRRGASARAWARGWGG